MIVQTAAAQFAARDHSGEAAASPGEAPVQRSEKKPSLPGLAAAIGTLLVSQFAFCWWSLVRSLAGSVDMRAFYAAGRIVGSGQGAALYRMAWEQQVQGSIFAGHGQMLPFLYPAYSALFFVPLARMPYRVAFAVFWLINGGLLALTATLLRRRLEGLHRLPWLLVVGGFACLFPVAIAWTQGQISFLLLLIYSLSYLLLEERRPFLAGLVAALALAKFQTALPVALLFLCWRVHRFVGGFFCGAVLAGVVSIAITGPAGVAEYLGGLRQVAGASLLHPAAATQAYGMFAGDMPTLHGFFFALTHGSLAAQAAAAVCSIATILWARTKTPSLPLALTIAMLVSYHLQPYDLVLLLLPLAVVLSRLLQGGLCLRQALVLALSIAALIAPVAPWLLVRGIGFLFLLPVVGVLWTVASGYGAASSSGATGVSDSRREFLHFAAR